MVAEIDETLVERGDNDKPDGRKLRFGPKNTKWAKEIIALYERDFGNS